MNILKAAGLILLGAVAVTLVSQRYVLAAVLAPHMIFDEIGQGVFVDGSLAERDRHDLLEDITAAQERIAALYGPTRARPRILVLATEEQGRTYGVPEPAPAQPYSVPWGTYILLKPRGRNVDVIAHEIVHAEVADRVGYLAYVLDVPVWFNEGLAMQVDHREEKIWRYLQEGRPLPPVSTLASGSMFFSGDQAYHYAAAQVEVARWLAAGDQVEQAGRVYAFLAALREGEEFSSIYSSIKP
jgi:hypothetical protein